MGLFGNRASLSAAQQVARGGDGVDPSTARPMAFEQGGVGRNIVGYMGDALLNMSGNKPIYGPSMQAQQQQALEYQRQMMLAQWKQGHPDPTPMQRNVEYFRSSGHPELAESYMRAEGNPQTLVTDPATGNTRFAPKGGEIPQQLIVKDLPGGGKAYLVNGAWYDNPEGRE